MKLKPFNILSLIIVVGSLALASCAKDSAGNVTLDPAARDLMLSVAQAEAHGLAADYLTTGNVDFKKDLISGALAQVYTLEGTATPAVQGTVGAVVRNVITDPALASAVTNAAVTTINAAPAGTSKTTAINQALLLLDQEVAKLRPPVSTP